MNESGEKVINLFEKSIPGFEKIVLCDSLKLKRGGLLKNPVLAYETWGKLSSQGDNVIVILTGLSASSHVASSKNNKTPGWWDGMVGKGKAIDTDKYYVICINSLGSCFGSTGPASINPATNEPYRLTFPELSIDDMAKATKLLLDNLNINKIHTLIGPSMGGMHALSLMIDNDNLVQERFNYDELVVNDDYVAYRGIKAKHIIFCEGFGLNKNKYFNYLPLVGTKGELLDIEVEDLELDFILKSGVFIIPLGGNKFKVGATNKWKDKTTDDYFKNIRVILFSLPGAFTPTCSTYQLPNFEKLFNEFKGLGIDKIYCLSVNDAFVMNAWAKSQNLKSVEVIPDGSAEFTRKMGMLVKKDNLGFGLRSWRYAALIDNKVIKRLWIEEGFGDNTTGDSYGISSPENILKDLKQL